MLLPVLLRAKHASFINLLMALVARILGNPAERLDRKCYRWIAEGSYRMAFHLVFPAVSGQEDFLKKLSFRIPRNAEEGMR